MAFGIQMILVSKGPDFLNELIELYLKNAKLPIKLSFGETLTNVNFLH